MCRLPPSQKDTRSMNEPERNARVLPRQSAPSPLRMYPVMSSCPVAGGCADLCLKSSGTADFFEA